VSVVYEYTPLPFVQLRRWRWDAAPTEDFDNKGGTARLLRSTRSRFTSERAASWPRSALSGSSDDSSARTPPLQCTSAACTISEAPRRHPGLRRARQLLHVRSCNLRSREISSAATADTCAAANELPDAGAPGTSVNTSLPGAVSAAARRRPGASISAAHVARETGIRPRRRAAPTNKMPRRRPSVTIRSSSASAARRG
jgi:hypothetical protein